MGKKYKQTVLQTERMPSIFTATNPLRLSSKMHIPQAVRKISFLFQRSEKTSESYRRGEPCFTFYHVDEHHIDVFIPACFRIEDPKSEQVSVNGIFSNKPYQVIRKNATFYEKKILLYKKKFYLKIV